jgi:hypothetical protein
MILDNLFAMVGGTGTATMLLAIVAFVGFAPASVILCPSCPLTRRLSRGG